MRLVRSITSEYLPPSCLPAARTVAYAIIRCPLSVRCSIGNRFPLHGDARYRHSVWDERLQLTHAQLLRHPLFKPRLVGSTNKAHTVELTPLDALPSLKRGRLVTMLAVLTQPEDGVWCIEDSRKSVALDLRRAQLTDGLFTETCVVLVEGVYDENGHAPGSLAELTARRHGGGGADASSGGGAGGASAVHEALGMGAGAASFAALSEGRLPGVLRVTMLGMPPVEHRVNTLRAMSLVDPFRDLPTPLEWERAHHLEVNSPANHNAMIVLASDVHLDSRECVENLRGMLRGFESVGTYPRLFVLQGNFCSTAFGQQEGDRDRFTALFDTLADVIMECPDLCRHSHFVLVPGPTDPGAASVLPRPPLPASLCGKLLNRSRIPRLTLTSNPCRIRYFTQELVIFRNDISLRLLRKSVVPLSRDSPHKLAYQVVHTLLHQAHLCPLPLSAQPVYWAHDHALRLRPVPDVLVLGEDQPRWDSRHSDDKLAAAEGERAAAEGRQPKPPASATAASGCLAISPGAFSRPTGIFSVYYPCQRRVEHCQVQQESQEFEEEGEEDGADGDLADPAPQEQQEEEEEAAHMQDAEAAEAYDAAQREQDAWTEEQAQHGGAGEGAGEGEGEGEEVGEAAAWADVLNAAGLEEEAETAAAAAAAVPSTPTRSPAASRPRAVPTSAGSTSTRRAVDAAAYSAGRHSAASHSPGGRDINPFSPSRKRLAASQSQSAGAGAGASAAAAAASAGGTPSSASRAWAWRPEEEALDGGASAVPDLADALQAARAEHLRTHPPTAAVPVWEQTIAEVEDEGQAQQQQAVRAGSSPAAGRAGSHLSPAHHRTTSAPASASAGSSGGAGAAVEASPAHAPSRLGRTTLGRGAAPLQPVYMENTLPAEVDDDDAEEEDADMAAAAPSASASSSASASAASARGFVGGSATLPEHDSNPFAYSLPDSMADTLEP